MRLMNNKARAFSLPTALTLLLAGCGGVENSPPGSGISVPGPGPSPTPTPVPTPTPTPSPASFGQIGLAQPGDFATLAWTVRYSTRQDGSDPRGLREPQPVAIELSYIAAANAYELLLPDIARNRLIPRTPGRFFTGLSMPWPNGPDVRVSLRKTGAEHPEFALSYTSLGDWDATRFDAADPNRLAQYYGDFVYGVPTPAGGVPNARAIRFTGIIHGSVVDYLAGQVDLTVDFAARTMSGFIRPVINDAFGGGGDPGRHDLRDVVFSTDGTSFSGRLLNAGGVSAGDFEGRFTGPAAEELMVRWRVMFDDPSVPARRTTAGVWAGKRS